MRHFQRNRFFKSAMHAAVQFPDLVLAMWEGGSVAVNNNLCSLPGSKQVVVPSNTCESAHCSCRSGYCTSSCLNVMVAGSKVSLPRQRTHAHMSAHTDPAR